MTDFGLTLFLCVLKMFEIEKLSPYGDLIFEEGRSKMELI